MTLNELFLNIAEPYSLELTVLWKWTQLIFHHQRGSSKGAALFNISPCFQAKHPEDAAGEHRDHDRSDGPGLPPDRGAVSAPVCPAVVHQSPEHPGQWREGLGLPGHVSDDQRQPQRGRPRLHLLLWRRGELDQPTGKEIYFMFLRPFGINFSRAPNLHLSSCYLIYKLYFP